MTEEIALLKLLSLIVIIVNDNVSVLDTLVWINRAAGWDHLWLA